MSIFKEYGAFNSQNIQLDASKDGLIYSYVSIWFPINNIFTVTGRLTPEKYHCLKKCKKKKKKKKKK